MAEKISPQIRSRMMSGIRDRNTRPEMTVRSFLHRSGFRFRLHRRGLPGRPDIVLPRWHAVVFVHGCFWHGHEGCRYFKLPKTCEAFWAAKIESNIRRDAVVIERLLEAGWRVGVVWECALRDQPAAALSSLQGFIRSECPLAEISSAE